MTRQLKDLMHEATERQAFTPDVGHLVATGRRQTRNRRLLAVVATAASVAVVATGTMFALGSTDHPSPAAPPASAAPEGSSGLCSDQDGNGLTAWAWPVIVLVQDTYGTSSVRHAPGDPSTIAYCTTEWGGGAKDSVIPRDGEATLVLRKSAAVGRGLQEPGSVTTAFGRTPKSPDLRVTVETTDGHVGIATVKGGFFAYRRVEQTPWPGPLPGAVIRFKFAGQPQRVVAQR
ncbi:hypothetical protein AB0P21_21025 [Kribbella sp. NPDC056861]|uniref:hypothetical protein n=1 Tax=Kribbella sp. NPDC056861 TaxID=3154857 RepID=UPI0034335E48